MQALHAAKLGLKAQQNRIDTIANNMFNVNTYGYKSQRTDFKDAFYTEILDPADLQRTDMKLGTGVLISTTSRDFEQGAISKSGEQLDLYIEGNGYFTTSDANGNIKYTRNGSFGVSSETDGKYLVNASGDYVMNDQLGKIKLPENAEEIVVDSDGVLSTGDQKIATLNIVTFINKDGLWGDGEFVETAASGAPVKSDAAVRQGALEASNVDLASEMSRLIRVQKAYALAGKAISTWDEIEQTTNNLRT